ncbi:hypothetical protein GS416_05465 [Rhodococcus hoagii]|nr:hypothetical protein [Prescottella equi]
MGGEDLDQGEELGAGFAGLADQCGDVGGVRGAEDLVAGLVDVVGVEQSGAGGE